MSEARAGCLLHPNALLQRGKLLPGDAVHRRFELPRKTLQICEVFFTFIRRQLLLPKMHRFPLQKFRGLPDRLSLRDT
jgi:hypothetical protein